MPPTAEGSSWIGIDEPMEKPGRIVSDPLTETEGLDLVGILSAIDETAYVWDIASDKIDWESNAGHILGVGTEQPIATGSAFQLLISPEHIARRTEAFDPSSAHDSVRGVAYRVQYKFMPPGRRSDLSIWVEDHGRWWPGADGMPVRARGVLRVINDRYWEEQRLLYRSDHDELTGQLNRIRLTEALTAVLGRAQRNGQPCAFLMVAVNNLAVINETFGFDIGDEVISAAAARSRNAARRRHARPLFVQQIRHHPERLRPGRHAHRRRTLHEGGPRHDHPDIRPASSRPPSRSAA